MLRAALRMTSREIGAIEILRAALRTTSREIGAIEILRAALRMTSRRCREVSCYGKNLLTQLDQIGSMP
jgi:hypothetical protein